MVTRLFTAELQGVNVASIAGKNEVIKKKNELWNLQSTQGSTKEVVTILDGDGISDEKRSIEEQSGQFRWNLYDIESYLLNSEYISQAIVQITLRRAGEVSVQRIETLFQSCAREVMQEIINSQLVDYVRGKLKGEVNQKVRRPDHKGEITEDDITGLVEGSKEAAKAINKAAKTITIEKVAKEFDSLKEGKDSMEIWNGDGWEANGTWQTSLAKGYRNSNWRRH